MRDGIGDSGPASEVLLSHHSMRRQAKSEKYDVSPVDSEKASHYLLVGPPDLSQGKWRAWRDSNPRPMASEATTLSG